MSYLPVEVLEYNDRREDNKVILNSDTGRIYIYIGGLAIEIHQSDDSKKVTVTALDRELMEQELGCFTVYFDDIQESLIDGDIYPEL